MKVLKIFAALIFITFTTQVEAQQNFKNRKAEISEKLNLTEAQKSQLEALKNEMVVERGKMNDKSKTEKRELLEKYDEKLKSILNEKQYYLYKEEMKSRRHSKKKNRKGNN
jgi:hypothetical protein